jgi:gliding motility-associated-like protein
MCDSSTIVGVGGADAPCLSSSHSLTLYTLRVDGETSINTNTLNITGDIVMNGMLNLLNSTIRLQGDMLNESEESYATGGKIEKMLPTFPVSDRVATGMGMSFTAATGYDSLLLTRRHEPWYHKGEYSISKVYELSQPVQLAGVDVAYLHAQSPKVTDTYLIYYKNPQGMGLENVPSETSTATKRVVSKNSEPFEADGLTVFPFPDLSFAKSITPNGDGINDCFEITGIEKFASSRLVVLFHNGNVIYDASPYDNNFCGEGLNTGTYYYMFFGAKSDGKPLKKGFFELVKEE